MDLIDRAGRWRLVDRMLAGYGTAVAMLSLTRLHQTGAPLVLVGHAAIPVLVSLIVHAPVTPVTRTIRSIYPIVLLVALYSAIDVMNGAGAAVTWDRQAQAVDQSIFGMQPSRDWWRAHPSAFWSTVLHGAYLLYYPCIVLPIGLFLLQRRHDVVERYLNGVIATYLVCYLFALLTPVAGPYYEFARPAGNFVANAPAQLVYRTLSRASAFGAAFPSSHVGAMVAATIGAWRGSRVLGQAMGVVTLLISVGVVYCQMHYAVDSLAGIGTGIVMARMVAEKR